VALRVATRASKLALTQSGMVADMLGGAELVEVSAGHVVMLEHPHVVTDAIAGLVERARPLAEERSA